MERRYRIFINDGFFEMVLKGKGILLSPKLVPNIPEATIMDLKTDEIIEGDEYV